MKRIYVDFNSTQDDDLGEYVPISPILRGLPRPEIEDLEVGELVVIFTEDLEVEAIVERSRKSQWWIARPNWDTKRFLQ